MKNFNVITMPGGEQHVTYTGPPLPPTPFTKTVRVHGIVTAEKLIAAGMACEIYSRLTHRDPILVLPYFPGARQDRTDIPEVGLSVAVYADILGSMQYSEIIILDPHSEATAINLTYANHLGSAGPFNRNIEIISHQRWFLHWIENTTFKPGPHKFLFPDKGAHKKYSTVSAYSPSKTCNKVRDPQTGKLSGFEVPSLRDWEDNFVWIIDDICDGGGTFIAIAEQIRAEMGNRIKLGLAVSHGIFSNDANIWRLSELFDYIVTTDSVHEAVPGWNKTMKIQVQPLTPILKEIGINA